MGHARVVECVSNGDLYDLVWKDLHARLAVVSILQGQRCSKGTLDKGCQCVQNSFCIRERDLSCPSTWTHTKAPVITPYTFALPSEKQPLNAPKPMCTQKALEPQNHAAANHHEPSSRLWCSCPSFWMHTGPTFPSFQRLEFRKLCRNMPQYVVHWTGLLQQTLITSEWCDHVSQCERRYASLMFR